jgi:TolA-binding protein
VRLARGTLVAHYQRGSSERLRIFSPGARTEIVGTTFSIEAGARSSRVAVAQGRVLVRGNDAHDRLVTAGHLWTSSQPTATALPKLPRSFARLFSEHARVTTDRRLGGHAQSTPPRRSLADGSKASAASGGAAVPAEASSEGAASPETPPAPAVETSPLAPPTTSAPAPAASESPTALPAPAASQPPATPPARVPVANAPPSDSPAAVYALAERAMSRGDLGEARRRLIQVIEQPAAGRLADAAGYELAQIALRAGELKEARARLEALAGSSLAEPADLLACEVELRAGDRDAARSCYRRFRLHHPGSVQDAEALGALLRLSPASADCTAGRALLDEYLTRYPEGSVAAEARQRRQRCAP